jgi:DNA-binding IclR family transcriptional regulator
MGSPSINKVLDVLDVLLNINKQLSIKEISDISGIKVRNLYRIMSDLVERDYIQTVSRGRYSLGPKLVSKETDSIFKRLRQIAYPYLQKLCDETNENVDMIGYYQGNTQELAIVMSEQKYQMVPMPGISVPLHATAAGKCILSKMSENDFIKFARNTSLFPYTKNTIANAAFLETELNMVRKNGVALDLEEFEIGIKAVASPLNYSFSGALASFGIFGPSYRLTQSKINQIVPIVKACAEEINKTIKSKAFYINL